MHICSCLVHDLLFMHACLLMHVYPWLIAYVYLLMHVWLSMHVRLSMNAGSFLCLIALACLPMPACACMFVHKFVDTCFHPCICMHTIFLMLACLCMLSGACLPMFVCSLYSSYLGWRFWKFTRSGYLYSQAKARDRGEHGTCSSMEPY